MAKFELKFLDCIDENNFIKVSKAECEFATAFENCNVAQVIRIQLEVEGNEVLIDLDKSTAIKFAKTLRTEINKITESEVNNG